MRRKRSAVLRLTMQYLPDRPNFSTRTANSVLPIRRISWTTHRRVFDQIRQRIIFQAYELTAEWSDELS